MGAKKHIKMMLIDKNGSIREIAEKTDRSYYTIRNNLYNDTMRFNDVERIAEIYGCKVVIMDEKTGRIY